MKIKMMKSDGTTREYEIPLSTPRNIFTDEVISGEAKQVWEANVAISKKPRPPPIKPSPKKLGDI